MTMLNALPTNYAPDGMAVGGLAQFDRSPSFLQSRSPGKEAATNLSVQAPPPNKVSPQPIAATRPRWQFQPERISGWCAAG